MSNVIWLIWAFLNCGLDLLSCFMTDPTLKTDPI